MPKQALPKQRQGKQVRANEGYPTIVRIGPYMYEILWLDETQWKERGEDDDLAGVSDHDRLYIGMRLAPMADIPRHVDTLRVTLWHEIQHAVWRLAGIDTLLKHHKIKRWEIEEQVIESTSGIFTQVMRDNPEVMRFIMNRSQL